MMEEPGLRTHSTGSVLMPSRSMDPIFIAPYPALAFPLRDTHHAKFYHTTDNTRRAARTRPVLLCNVDDPVDGAADDTR